MAAEPITLDELTSELNRLGVGIADAGKGMTTEEWGEHWGMSASLARQKLKKVAKVAKVIPRQIPRQSFGGQVRTYTVYEIVLPAKSKGKKR
jgi:hypothetical protein